MGKSCCLKRMAFAKIQHFLNNLKMALVEHRPAQFDRCEPIESRDQPDDGGSLMKQEINRILSYRNWPVKFMDPNKLAKAGFYYTKKDDSVCCAFCNIVLNQWQEGDDPMEDHKKWSANCPFVQGRDCRNIPSTLDSVPMTEGHDVCGRFAFQIMPNSLPEQETPRLPSARSYGLPHHGGPVYKEYASLDQRLKSYRNWPSDKKLTPEQLATAGFFYQGVDDRTVCFYCRGGLNNWEDDDDAWEQHAKWFPKCSFVSMQKGELFISEVHNKLGDAVLSKAEAVTLEVPSDLRTNLKVDESAATTSTAVEKPKEVKTKDLATEGDKHSDCTTCKMCKICYLKEVGIAFIPCGHTVACVDCTSALSSCPFCREPINATLRVFPL